VGLRRGKELPEGGHVVGRNRRLQLVYHMARCFEPRRRV
jgi:hypothetical protein